MNRNRSLVVMMLLCWLPLLAFYLMAIFGFAVSPLVVILLLLLCCLAMSHMLMASEEGASCHSPKTRPETEPTRLPDTIRFDDIFDRTATQNAGGTLILSGQLLTDPTLAHEQLEERFQGSGLTPLLQNDEDGQPRILVLPISLDEPDSSPARPWINGLLFAGTLLTTTWAGALHQGVNLIEEPNRFMVGVPYSFALMLILGAHELGHYFAARAYGMKVSLPYFIPVPFALGTFGAFIRLKSPSKTRKVLFDVGVAGPLAGLVFAVPALWLGLGLSEIMQETQQPGPNFMHHGTSVGSSILLTIMSKLALGEAVSHGHMLALHPLAFAGWLGLLVTALNLLPIGQLDGGHIADAMFGQRRGAAISTAALITLFFLGLFVWSGLLTWAFIAFFIAGSKGIPPLNDITELDTGRKAVGAFAFLLLVAILVPVPHAFYQSLGIHCPYV